MLLAFAALMVALVAAPVASASDTRAGDTADRLFYGSPVQVNDSLFTADAGEAAVNPNTAECTRGATPTPGVKMNHTAWYRIVGTGGSITLSTAGSVNGTNPMDTVLAIYNVGGTTALACSDDVTNVTNLTSSITFASAANTTYEVQAGLFSENGATLCSATPPGCELHLSATNPFSPANDLRANATALTSSATANNSFASEEANEILQCPNQGSAHNITRNYAKTIWYKFVAPANGTAAFRSGGGVDTVAAVYAGGSNSFLACNDDDAPGIFTSHVDVPVTAGTTYFLQVGGFNGAFGNFAVSVDFAATPPNHDLDGDGTVGGQFGGPDCNDSNAAIHPGATDKPGNGVDENCDGHDAAACVVPRLKGHSLKADRKKLRKAHCKLGKVKGEQGKGATVKSQSAKSGTILPAGSKVNVKLT